MTEETITVAQIKSLKNQALQLTALGSLMTTCCITLWLIQKSCTQAAA